MDYENWSTDKLIERIRQLEEENEKLIERVIRVEEDNDRLFRVLQLVAQDCQDEDKARLLDELVKLKKIMRNSFYGFNSVNSVD